MTLFSFCREYKSNEKSVLSALTATYQHFFLCGCIVVISPGIKDIAIVLIAKANSSHSVEPIVTYLLQYIDPGIGSSSVHISLLSLVHH